MKVLNLFAGLGGNVFKVDRSKFEIVSVESNPKIVEQYKILHPQDKIIQGDAMKYLLEHHDKFEAFIAGPPCQTHSTLSNQYVRFIDPQLWQLHIFANKHFDGLWLIENVKISYIKLGYPLPNAFLGRHSIWSNFHVPTVPHKSPPNFSKAKREVLVDYLGFDYQGNIYMNGNHDPCQILRNAVHPKLGKIMFESLYQANTKQGTLEAFHE